MPAFELHRGGFPAIAGSNVNDHVAVQHDVGDTQRQVLPAASKNVEPVGVTLASAVAGNPVTVFDYGNVVKVTAGASLGAGSEVGVASTNGALGPVAGASGSVVWSVGRSETAAAPGEVFSLYVRPRQLSGLA